MFEVLFAHQHAQHFGGLGIIDVNGIGFVLFDECAEPAEVLRRLMSEHNLKQADLASEIGSQGIVSEVLRGKRTINARQAKALAARFNVSASAFI